jgi:ribonucleoside-diphosphate reductase beta chain
MILKTKDLKKRYSIFPVTHMDLWEYFYVKAIKQFWVVEEAALADDKFDELDSEEKEYLKNILAFFAVSDGLVIDNLATNFYNEVDILEAQYYYGQQILIEQIHAEAYSLMIDTYVKNLKEKEDLFNSMETNPAVAKKAKWAEAWIEHESFVHRLIAFACVEGLSFSSVFAGVFWFRSRNKMNGLGQMNELIIRDESQHYEFAVYLYNNYVNDEYKLDEKTIRDIVLGCYEVEKTFVEESMPLGLKGLTKEKMIQYIQFVADVILKDFGLKPEFNVSNPLDFMARLGLLTKNNFFEQRVGQYTRVDIPENSTGIFDDEF